MVFRNLCICVHWMKVALALEGLNKDRIPTSGVEAKQVLGWGSDFRTCENVKIELKDTLHLWAILALFRLVGWVSLMRSHVHRSYCILSFRFRRYLFRFKPWDHVQLNVYSWHSSHFPSFIGPEYKPRRSEFNPCITRIFPWSDMRHARKYLHKRSVLLRMIWLKVASPVGLTLLMLRLLSSNAQECKKLWKSSNPSHLGIHRKALVEYIQMSTHMPGFQNYFKDFCIILYWLN